MSIKQQETHGEPKEEVPESSPVRLRNRLANATRENAGPGSRSLSADESPERV